VYCPYSIQYPCLLREFKNHGKSEEYLGASGLSSEFEIITKASMVLTPGGATKEGILKDWGLSTAALNTDHVCLLSFREIIY